jgi:hypothetical protein
VPDRRVPAAPELLALAVPSEARRWRQRLSDLAPGPIFLQRLGTFGFSREALFSKSRSFCIARLPLCRVSNLCLTVCTLQSVFVDASLGQFLASYQKALQLPVR